MFSTASNNSHWGIAARNMIDSAKWMQTNGFSALTVNWFDWESVHMADRYGYYLVV